MNDASPQLSLTPQTMLPDLLTRHPEARPVFDRYGLSGCGGPLGPHESIQFFARTHGVEESRLMDEINTAIDQAAAGVVQPSDAPSVADTIYRRFFLGAIVLGLTAGASWGVWLLWSIGLKGDFFSVSLHHVNAHGHAQIFGWVGLFIMGFAYQAFPRLWHTRLTAPGLAAASFTAMLAGIIVRTIGMTAPQTGWGVTWTLIGGALEMAAIFTFVTLILATFLKSKARLEPYVGFVIAALVFFILQAALSLWHSYQTMIASSMQALIIQVVTWQSSLRDLQIQGLALFMILGVSQRMLPALFEVPALRPRRAWLAFSILLAAVAGEIGIFQLYIKSGEPFWAGLTLIPKLMLAAGCIMIAWPWKLWRPLRTVDGGPERSAKFIQAAWGWLAVSLAMMLLTPVYRSASGIPFSHAYSGAVRHAITVGFISLMIMGYAAKVVPTLAGVAPRALSTLWLPFWLVNTGCFLRVSLQTLTDWHPAFFAAIGVSGVLEVTGLAIWGGHLGRIMWRSRRNDAPAFDAGAPPSSIDPTHSPAQVIAWFPATLPVFEAYGFGLIRNPVLRHTVARQVTLAQASAMHGAPLQAFVHDLNAAAFGGSAPQCEGCHAKAEGACR